MTPFDLINWILVIILMWRKQDW